MLLGRTEWPAPSGNDAVAENEVHVWRAGLDRGAASIPGLWDVLSRDEREKAARFHFEADSHRFVLGRGVLRQVLARCLGRRAEELRFDYGSFGKPALAPGVAESPLQFNVSHSGDLVLIAIAVRRAVGIDVERIRTDIAVDRIAEHYFSPAERKSLAGLDAGLRHDAFHACWTRKEAYLKATGVGLSLPLDQFDVSLAPGEAARLVATRPDPAEAQRWVLLELDAGRNYKAAVAVEGEGVHLATWDWQTSPTTPIRHRPG
jgi:4'-phosphopantetheinyl transferase